ncbi:hypothetical protein ACLK1T_01320 [Escherichia coli]
MAVGVWAAIGNVCRDDYGEGGFREGFMSQFRRLDDHWT